MELNKIPEEKNWGLYAGLLLGGLILAIASISLFRDILDIFSKSIEISAILIFRMLLMALSAYASISCFIGFFKMSRLEKNVAGKVREEYEDFLLYARPLVEEVIRQRIVGEQLIEKIETYNAREKRQALQPATAQSSLPRWAKFQFFATLLGTATVGLYVFLEAHPWELVPYSVLILSFLWYLVVGGYFGVLNESRSYYLPALFIAILPTTSMLLRIQMQLYQVLYVVFIILGLYILLMVIHFEYLVSGRLPFGLNEINAEALNEARRRRSLKEEPVHAETDVQIDIGETIKTPPGPDIGKETILPDVDISNLIKEIEMKKQLKMKQMLSGIKNNIELPDYEQKSETISQLPDRGIINVISNFNLRAHKIIWPVWLCHNWKKISLLGIIMILLGIAGILALSEADMYLEIIFLGIILSIAGYSLSWKTERKIFTLLSIPYVLGFIMSVWAVISLFQFLNIYRFEEELKNLSLAYIAGILLMVSDTFIIRIRKIRNTIGQLM